MMNMKTSETTYETRSFDTKTFQWVSKEVTFDLTLTGKTRVTTREQEPESGKWLIAKSEVVDNSECKNLYSEVLKKGSLKK